MKLRWPYCSLWKQKWPIAKDMDKRQNILFNKWFYSHTTGHNQHDGGRYGCDRWILYDRFGLFENLFSDLWIPPGNMPPAAVWGPQNLWIYSVSKARICRDGEISSTIFVWCRYTSFLFYPNIWLVLKSIAVVSWTEKYLPSRELLLNDIYDHVETLIFYGIIRIFMLIMVSYILK